MSLVRKLRRVLVDVLAHLRDRRRGRASADIAEAAEQAEDERRQGEQREEARLRGEPGHAVPQADADGRHDQTGERKQPGKAGQRPPEASPHVRHVAHGSRRTLETCTPTSSPTSSRRPKPRRPDDRCAADRGSRALGHASRCRRRGGPPGTRHGGRDHHGRGWAEQADRITPVLRTHAPTGERIDEVEYHPAYHRLMEVAVGQGLTAEPWTRPAGQGAHARRAAGFVVWSQVDAGHLCPVSMTYAAVPALAAEPALAARWLPGLASRAYDPVLRPMTEKQGLTVGMGMTERQGGSDVRANTTRAVATPVGHWRVRPTGSPATSGSARRR